MPEINVSNVFSAPIVFELFCCIPLWESPCIKARLHRQFLLPQLDAIFVVLKLHQVSNMFETPAILRRQISLKIAPGLHVRF